MLKTTLASIFLLTALFKSMPVLAFYCPQNQVKRAIAGDSVALNMLIENTNYRQNPAVLAAAKWGEIEILKTLISRGSDITLHDDIGTPLIYAAGGFDVDYMYELDTAKRNGNYSAYSLDPEGCRSILERISEKRNRNPIAESKRIEVIELLLSSGAKLDSIGNEGFTALHFAVFNHYSQLTSFLLSKGADVGAKDMKGKTPLYWAVYNSKKSWGDYEVVKSLLKYRASIYAADNGGLTPLDVARSNNDKKMEYLLLNKVVSEPKLGAAEAFLSNK